ncbi:MAG TPA: SRPBCC family protein [Vicinamibacterales bacterium]|nr:SRPBCC family protein [Vicinamibacterales bacterium]
MAVTHLNRAQARRRYANVGSLERWGSVVVGGALVTYGLSRRTKAGAGIAAAGTTLLLRGTTGHCPVYSTMGVSTAADDTRHALAGTHGFHVHEAIRLEKPIDEVYRFWRQLENLPRFMTHLQRVVDLGNKRSRWTAKGPAGSTIEWDAEIINEVENKVIGWRSLPNSDLVTAGSVNFDRVRAGRETQLTVHLQYAPPGGRVGKLIAQVFGDEPAQAVREDLRRMKWLLEAGEIPRATAEQQPGGWTI